MDDQKQHVIDSLKQGTNILVTVKNSPSIDQLAACIALTLIINELGKHGTAVFSGEVPSALEFLEPEKTIERNTDSLRDFIISLDKAKADKLRYKVEDKVVKIFITPYRTSLSNKDLEFGQGDFNVDVVVALGVHDQNDLDEAITAHGRILHDATVISLNTAGDANKDLGSLNWTDDQVSSLSEMVALISEELGKDDVIDNQIATALLTGIVAETERFGNAKTKPATMEVAAKLLTAGANQELVATKLAEPATPPPPPVQPEPIRYEEPARDMLAEPVGSDTNSGSVDIPQPDTSNTPPPVAQDASFQINSNGELSIEHPHDEPAPESPAESFEPASDARLPLADNQAIPAQEPSIELPMPDTSPAALPPEGGVPPVYDPGQPGPDNPPSPPSFPDSPPTSETPAGQGEPGEEQAALDYLKERKVDTSNSRVIEPLHGHDDLAGLPEIGPAVADPNEQALPAPALSNSKYTFTPPTMGGTLTANLPTEDTADALAPRPVTFGINPPLLTHERPAGSIQPVPEPEEVVAESAPEPTLANEASEKPAIAPEPIAKPEPQSQPSPPSPVAPEAVQAEPPPVPASVIPELKPEVLPQPPQPQPAIPSEPPKLEAAAADEHAPESEPVKSEPEISRQAASSTPGETPVLEAALAPDAGAHLPQPPKEVPSAQPQPVVASGPQIIQATPLGPESYHTLADLEAQVHSSHPTNAYVANGTSPAATNQPKLEALPDAHSSDTTDMPLPASIKLPLPQMTSATGTSGTSPLAPPPPVPPPIAAL